MRRTGNGTSRRCVQKRASIRPASVTVRALALKPSRDILLACLVVVVAVGVVLASPRDAAAQTAAYHVPDGHLLLLPAGGGEPRAIQILDHDGEPMIAAADAAGLLRATRYWRSETRKLLLRVGDHRIRMGVGNPFWIIDDVAHRLAPPILHRGAVWMPVAFFPLASELGIIASCTWDPERRTLSLGSGQHSVGNIALEEAGEFTRLSIEVRRGIQPLVISADLDRFALRFPSAVARPSILGRVQSLGRFERIEVLQGQDGVSIFMRVSGNARGYALRAASDPHRIEILVGDEWGRHKGLVFQPFELGEDDDIELPEEDEVETGDPPGLRPKHVVIDAGHGGEDEGSRSLEGRLEKHLTLEIAQRLARRLKENGTLRVTLVRTRDERIDVPRRVELANGLGADLFLSLHCDLNGPLSRGGYVAIARGVGGGQMQYEDLSPSAGSASRAEVLSLARWESAGSRYVFAAFQLARSIADHIEVAFPKARGQALTRPVWNLEGAQMPAVLIELGTLDPGAQGDPGEIMSRGSFMNAAADAIAAGVEDALAPELGSNAEGGLQGEKF